MSYRFIFLGLLVVCTSSLAAKIKHQPISVEATNYIKKSLKFEELLKECNEYEYGFFASTVTTKTSKVENIEIVDWAVVDNIGTKMDLHLYSFQTTNGKVTSKMKLIHESEDWQYYLDECKAHDK